MTEICPLRFFYGIFDLAEINAMVLLQTARNQNNIVRRKYQQELGYHLAEPHMKKRTRSNNLPRELKVTIRKMANIQEEEKEEDDNPPRYKDWKTKSACVKCHIMLCAEHKCDVCPDCV
ncbi:hypothetical protein PR048_016505 [Dryococelus australis]|uniref:PiggyBac transposable element-derived protein domain-containing protein n=1 Tax=Dryococelus australis TaxID=614101 RepID=A0ABQ9HK65_9NEOP|nr:hypothetical protein PR048_016505 [Dryococelus australis]